MNPKPENEVVYGVIPIKANDTKNDHEMRIFAHTYGNTRMCHIREFWKPKIDETWRAGKGVSFKEDLLIEIVAILCRMSVRENGEDKIPENLSSFVGDLIEKEVQKTPETYTIDYKDVAKNILPDLLAAGALLEMVAN